MFKPSNAVRIRDGKAQVYMPSRRPPHSPPGAFASYKELAYNGGAGNSVSFSAMGNNNINSTDGLLTGFVSEQEASLRKIYRDIYYHDPVGGAAVDMMSTLPFGDFELYGCSEERLDKYRSSIAQLNMVTAAPEITRQHLVDGAYVSTLVFSNKEKLFTDQLPYDLGDLEFDYSPFYSHDPKITATSNKRIQSFLQDSDVNVVQQRSRIPDKLLRALESGSYVLDPLTTLFLPRRMFSTSTPVSLYRRLLPIYLLEKTLFRGTLFEAGRRQRSTLHAAVGDDTWEPTPEELNMVVQLAQQADLDPMGGIVATRNGVQFNEFREAGNFWKWTDVVDQTTSFKLKAMGISDAFLSGDATFSNSDAAIMVFMEHVSAFRNYFTHSIFSNKLFPLIAVVNGFYKEGVEYVAKNSGHRMNDYSKLDIPKVRWNKSLSSRNDERLMEMLDKLSEKGWPIGLRTWAAAAGIDSSTLMNDLKEEPDLRKQIEGLMPKQPGDAEGEEDLGDMLGAKLKEVGMMNREIGMEPTRTSKTGKKLPVRNPHAVMSRENEELVKAKATIVANPDKYDDFVASAQGRISATNAYGKMK